MQHNHFVPNVDTILHSIGKSVFPSREKCKRILNCTTKDID